MASTSKTVRIGNAQAFWGDRTGAAAEMLAREPGLEYLTLDYLAEVSMSILAIQRERDPDAGFARDFVDVVRSLAPYWSRGGTCRVIANAGGLNPRDCAEACRAALAEAGCRTLRIGVITGDDVLEILRAATADSLRPKFRNLDSGESISHVGDRLVTANAYLGAAPIVQALAGGADIVITGRVADPSLVAAACIHHFGWNETDYDRLAGATVAGHLIECGTQVTGGISTDWLDVPNVGQIGYPIVEVAEDGSCIVTKPRGTGGCVTELTVKEQLLYEIGDPENYLSPDVTVSFLKLAVDDLGNDRVRVSGAMGRPHSDSYKVSATYRDGYWGAGTLTIIGREAAAKARRCGELVLQRIRDAGYELRGELVECLGTGDGAVGIADSSGDDSDRFAEVVLRIAVETDSREAAECFSRELMPYITAGPQGTTGYAEGRPRVHPIFRYWPCLIARGAVAPQVEILESAGNLKFEPWVARPEPLAKGVADVARASHALRRGLRDVPPIQNTAHSHLFDIACARSGDKGISANVGIIARRADWWPFLRTWLTADRVGKFFSPLEIESVQRYELPNLRALNFVLRGALRQRLRTDAQGKALGQVLLEMRLPADPAPIITSNESFKE
jgi:hypothetical protein